MTPYNLLDAITDINDDLIKSVPKRNKKRILAVALGGLAACLAVTVAILWHVHNNDVTYNEPVYGTTEDMVLVEEDYVDIYFVNDGVLSHESVYTQCAPFAIFSHWKEKNGIGAEVTLLKCYTEDNGTTTTSEFMGQTVVQHQVGDYFALHIQVSENLAEYYGTVPETALIESLKLTFKGYLGIKFDDCFFTLG